MPFNTYWMITYLWSLNIEDAAAAVAITETAPALVGVQGCMTPKALGLVRDPHPSRSADCLHLLHLLQMPSIGRPTSAGQRSLQGTLL